VSFLKVLQLTRQLWESFAWSEGERTRQLAARFSAHYFAALRLRELLPPRPILFALDPPGRQLFADKTSQSNS
jgi:hypothetical protein